jgi:hypothetical protein
MQLFTSLRMHHLSPYHTTYQLEFPFEIMCDASDHVVGAILGQTKNKMHHAICFASKTLRGAQLNCATIEKELLAMVFAFDKF